MVVNTTSPLEGTFSTQKQDVVQPSCSSAETTKKLNKDSVVQHKNIELKQARDHVGNHVWTKSITSNIVNERGEAYFVKKYQW